MQTSYNSIETLLNWTNVENVCFSLVCLALMCSKYCASVADCNHTICRKSIAPTIITKGNISGNKNVPQRQGPSIVAASCRMTCIEQQAKHNSWCQSEWVWRPYARIHALTHTHITIHIASLYFNERKPIKEVFFFIILTVMGPFSYDPMTFAYFIYFFLRVIFFLHHFCCSVQFGMCISVAGIYSKRCSLLKNANQRKHK